MDNALPIAYISSLIRNAIANLDLKRLMGNANALPLKYTQKHKINVLKDVLSLITFILMANVNVRMISSWMRMVDVILNVVSSRRELMGNANVLKGITRE